MSALSSSFALLLACAAFLGYELVTFRKSMVADLTGDANAIAYNVTAPLLFDDPKAAAASLEALKAKPAIHSAVLRGRADSGWNDPDSTTVGSVSLEVGYETIHSWGEAEVTRRSREWSPDAHRTAPDWTAGSGGRGGAAPA